MATEIQAIAALCPRIVYERTVGNPILVRYLMGRTGLSQGQLLLALTELRDAIFFFHQTGQPVQLTGLGIFTPTISLQGEFKIVYRVDPYLKNQLNGPGQFWGEIQNRENIGKTKAELIALWNILKPEDPVL